MSPLAAMAADIQASVDSDQYRSRARRRVEAATKLLFTTRLQAVVLLRLGQWLRPRLSPLAAIVKYVNAVMAGCDIALEAPIGPGLRLFHPTGVVIGPDCAVGARCVVMQGVTLGAGKGGSPSVGDDVFIGPGAKIFGAVTIGERCHIGANAVVLESVPAGSFVAGVPARVVKTIWEPTRSAVLL